MRRICLFLVSLAACLVSPAATAHELWLHYTPGGDAAVIRLSFGDSPDLNAAERVAEISNVKLWSGVQSLEVTRLPDGLEAKLPRGGSAVISALADRGVVTHNGQSSVIYLAAYSQTLAVEPDKATSLGLDDDQPRLLLFSRDNGPPVIRASRKGKPVLDAAVKVFRGTSAPTELRTDARGEIPCPDLREGPWHLLVQVVDRTPGKRDGRDYSEIRYKATLAISPEAAFGPAVAACLDRVKEAHGAAGPWAVAGYRIGERALKDLGLRRHSHDLEVVHHCPLQVQYSCMADGLSAATGASPGKLNLRIEESPVTGLKTLVRDRQKGRSLTFTLKPEFVRSIADLPFDRLEAAGRRVASLPDDAIFNVSESK